MLGSGGGLPGDGYHSSSVSSQVEDSLAAEHSNSRTWPVGDGTFARVTVTYGVTGEVDDDGDFEGIDYYADEKLDWDTFDRMRGVRDQLAAEGETESAARFPKVRYRVAQVAVGEHTMSVDETDPSEPDDRTQEQLMDGEFDSLEAAQADAKQRALHVDWEKFTPHHMLGD